MQNAQQSCRLTSEVKFPYQPGSQALRVSMDQISLMYDGIINIDCKLVRYTRGVAFHIILTNWRSSQGKKGQCKTLILSR